MKEEIISLKNISKTFVQSSFDGTVNFKALDEISLTVFKGESLLISGANGSGKTLLMSIIAGLIRPSSACRGKRKMRHSFSGFRLADIGRNT